MDILNIAIKFAIILFPLGELARIQFGNTIALNLLDIAISLIALTYCLRKIKNKTIPQTTIAKVTTLFICTAILSLLVNISWLQISQVAIAFLYLLRWSIYAMVYFAVNEMSHKQKQTITQWIFTAGGVLLGLGYLQIFFFANLQPLYHLGWDKHMYRMVSTFLDPNFFGTFLVLYCLFIFGYIQPIQNANRRNQIIIRGILGLTLLAIFLTNSRTALVCLVASIVIYALLLKKKKLILGIVILLAIGFLCILPFSHIENLNLLRINSSKARLDTWKNATKIFQKNLLFGVGFNAYRYAQIKYNLRTNNTTIPSHADAGSDNSLLFILATTGIVGFTAYGLMWGKLVEKTYLIKQKVYAKILLASLGGLLISSLFINSLFYPQIMFWIWIFAGIIDLK